MLILTTLLLLPGQVDQPAPGPRWQTSVGAVVRVEGLVLPGPELAARPIDDRKQAVVLRITNIYPHGTAHRYDLEFYVLDPGTFDLREAFRRPDGAPPIDLPPLLVKAESRLPPGHVRPHELSLESGITLGGYYRWVYLALGLWLVGLGAIVFVGRSRKKQNMIPARAPVTLAARLQPLVESAIAGKASPTELANLERALLAYWRRKLSLERGEPGQVMVQLQAHPEAGPLLVQLESWLHRPDADRVVEPAILLNPYRHLPPDTLDQELTGAAR